MTRRYAETTKVPVMRSVEEIKKTLNRYGAGSFGFLEEGNSAAIIFRHEGLTFRIDVPYPDKDDGGYTDVRYDQEVRRRWRSMALVVKAKLEAVASEISTVDKEFLGDIVMPDGSALFNGIRPKIYEAAREGKMPKSLLPGIENG